MILDRDADCVLDQALVHAAGRLARLKVGRCATYACIRLALATRVSEEELLYVIDRGVQRLQRAFNAPEKDTANYDDLVVASQEATGATSFLDADADWLEEQERDAVSLATVTAA